MAATAVQRYGLRLFANCCLHRWPHKPLGWLMMMLQWRLSDCRWLIVDGDSWKLLTFPHCYAFIMWFVFCTLHCVKKFQKIKSFKCLNIPWLFWSVFIRICVCEFIKCTFQKLHFKLQVVHWIKLHLYKKWIRFLSLHCILTHFWLTGCIKCTFSSPNLHSVLTTSKRMYFVAILLLSISATLGDAKGKFYSRKICQSWSIMFNFDKSVKNNLYVWQSAEVLGTTAGALTPASAQARVPALPRTSAPAPPTLNAWSTMTLRTSSARKLLHERDVGHYFRLKKFPLLSSMNDNNC